MGEATHDEEREEKDLLFSVVSPDSNSVYVVVRLRPGQENCGGDPTREERSVCFPPSHPLHIPESSRGQFDQDERYHEEFSSLKGHFLHINHDRTQSPSIVSGCIYYISKRLETSRLGEVFIHLQ